MSKDHSKKIYAEAFKREEYAWGFKVYHYDETGNREIRLFRSEAKYRDRTDAENAASDYCDEHGIDAEMS